MAYGIYEMGVCRYCGQDIERRRLLGWLHVQGFYVCAGQKDADKETLKVAEPRP